MDMDIKFEGLNETIANIENLTRKVNTVENQALNDGAAVFAHSLSLHTPISEEGFKTHAAYNVNTSRVSTDGKFDAKSIKIGYGSDTYWYMWFVNEGTYSKGNPKGIKPRHHVEKAFEYGKDKAQSVMKQTLEALL